MHSNSSLHSLGNFDPINEEVTASLSNSNNERSFSDILISNINPVEPQPTPPNLSNPINLSSEPLDSLKSFFISLFPTFIKLIFAENITSKILAFKDIGKILKLEDTVDLAIDSLGISSVAI